MEVKAIAKNVRISPQKARLVVDKIKNMSPKEAISVLDFVPKFSSPILKKVIKSAVANAINNANLSEESLVFKHIFVTKSLYSKRYRPVARGRAHTILRKTSHISVILEGNELKNPPVALVEGDKKEEDKNGTKS